MSDEIKKVLELLQTEADRQTKAANMAGQKYVSALWSHNADEMVSWRKEEEIRRTNAIQTERLIYHIKQELNLQKELKL